MNSSDSTALPIDEVLPDIVAALREGRSVVVEAPPGAGKTTRVPRALLEAGVVEGEIWILEPRRLPARLAAERVARELGERVGETVGYTVRFEDVSSPRTRLRFVTEGLLTRRLLGDPKLTGVGAVVLDEFHERHVATDLSLALLRRLQTGARPDLRVCAMSATLEAEPLRAFLGGCAGVRSEGRLYPIEIEHLPTPDDRPVHEQVTGAVRRLVRDRLDGDVLVFLPGAGEIRRAQELLAAAPGMSAFAVLPLHGELPLEDQARAVRRDPARRKIILSTNVAESSITVEGVVAVVDAGLARVATHSPWTGLPTLALAKVSQASATQRAGRAGRVRPGRALRLYTRHDHDARRAYDLPEIARADLADTLLTLAALDTGPLADFPWFEEPPAAALGAARDLLRALGALDTAGTLTPLGRRMARLPVHPRLARLVCEGETRGAGAAACLVAALISERDLRRGARASFSPGSRRGGAPSGESGEILDLVDLYREAEKARFRADTLRALDLDARATDAVSRARRQLVAALPRDGRAPLEGPAEDAALRTATLAAFSDRVAKRRAPHDRVVVLASGGSAELQFDPGAEWLVAVDVEERGARAAGGRPGGVTVRLAAAIEPEWLLDVCADRVEEIDALVWNAATERVDRRTGLRFGALSLDESVTPAPPSEEASRLLAEAALARGLERLPGAEELPRLLARLAFARSVAPADAALPALANDDVGALLRLACVGRRGFAELAEANLAAIALESLPPEAQRLLRTLAPERVTLPGGRGVAVNYAADQPPWIESRLQDFFGLRVGPTIGGGRVPLTLHLLAPNGRAVQVTRDLANFWKQHYPPLRRELGRRYPRHAWPEDGATATPPPPKPPRPR
ncbi:MAG TPA: ATP-dependent helicase HrpB [Polyangia bacterium]|nr:ATP-dependent helicase HrpB [Polyangia bacterium]